MLKYLCQFLPTHGLAPGESSGVVLFNKGLQFSPDTQVGANPLHMARVTTARPTDIQIIFFTAFSILLGFFTALIFIYCINLRQWTVNDTSDGCGLTSLLLQFRFFLL